MIDRPGMESVVFFYDKYTQGRSVELANLIENHTGSDTVMTPCMHTTYESYNNIAKTIQPGGGSRGGGLRVARQYGRENVQEYVQGVHNSLLACSQFPT